MKVDMKDGFLKFLDERFDKLLISFFVLLFTCISLFFAIKGINGKAFDWATNGFGMFFGLLAGLITGIAVGRASKQLPPSPPSSSESPSQEGGK